MAVSLVSKRNAHVIDVEFLWRRRLERGTQCIAFNKFEKTFSMIHFLVASPNRLTHCNVSVSLSKSWPLLSLSLRVERAPRRGIQRRS